MAAERFPEWPGGVRQDHLSAWKLLEDFFDSCGNVLLVGAGGKTTLMWRMALLRRQSRRRVFAGTTTKVALPLAWADQRIDMAANACAAFPEEGIIFFHRGVTDAALGGQGLTKATGLTEEDLFLLSSMEPMIIEADGSRGLPLKAPAPWEPVLTDQSFGVVLVVGAGALGGILGSDLVHRPELFSQITGLESGGIIEPWALAELILSSRGYGRVLQRATGAVLLFNKAPFGPGGELEQKFQQAALETLGSIAGGFPGILGFAGRLGEGYLVNLG